MNKSRELYAMYIKQGMTKEDALFAVLDTYNSQHWEDRDRYHQRIKRLEGSRDEA